MSENKQHADGSDQDPKDTAHVDENNDQGQSDIDYKARAEDLERELGQAKHTIVKLKRGTKEDENDDQSGVDPENLENVVKKVLNESKEADQLLRINEVLDEEITKITTNPDEQKLIRLIYDEKITKGGMSRAEIKKDIEMARAIANYPVVTAKSKEFAESVRNNAGSSPAGGSGGGQFKDDTQISNKLNSAELSLLQRYKVDPNKVGK